MNKKKIKPAELFSVLVVATRFPSQKQLGRGRRRRQVCPDAQFKSIKNIVHCSRKVTEREPFTAVAAGAHGCSLTSSQAGSTKAQMLPVSIGHQPKRYCCQYKKGLPYPISSI